jgi:hypothetical protein
MQKTKMSYEEKADLLFKVFELYNSGRLEEAAELGKTVPVEKFAERALGRDYLEANGFNTSELE